MAEEEAESDVTLWRERKTGIDDIYAAYEEGKRRYQDKWDNISRHIQDWYRGLPPDHPARDHEHYRFADGQGVYFASDLSGPDDGRKNRPRYVVLHPTTGKAVPVPSRGWRWEEPRMKQEIAAGRVHFGADESSVPNGKVYLRENEWQAISSVFYKDRRAASGALKKLFGEKVFDFPKDATVLERFVAMLCRQGDIVLDFFAGSGSTAEAVLRSATKRQIALRFILVQLPEPLEENGRAWNLGMRTIFDIAKQRVLRIGQSLRDDNPMFAGDVGFRVFKLDSSNIRAWDPNAADLAATLDEHAEHLKTNRSETDILYELLLKLGLDLCVPIQHREMAGKTVHSIGGGVLFACLSTAVTREDVEPLAQGIVAWRKELAPAGDTTCVFRDSAFADDVAKTNLAAILAQHGLENVRSL